MYIYTNPNPNNILVGDCTVRAIALLLDKDWQDIYIGLCLKGYELFDMPNSNIVWGTYLEEQGYHRVPIPNTCPFCYTINDFCLDHPNGIYLLATGTHVVTCIDGNIHDTWDSGNELPIYYWEKQ